MLWPAPSTYGQRGRISAREVYHSGERLLVSNLILACIVYWQARKISPIAAAADYLLRRVSVSPIEWKNERPS